MAESSSTQGHHACETPSWSTVQKRLHGAREYESVPQHPLPDEAKRGVQGRLLHEAQHIRSCVIASIAIELGARLYLTQCEQNPMRGALRLQANSAGCEMSRIV
jgi:hypothetical protein